MSVKVAKSRFITSSLKGLYKYLTYNLSSFQALGERLIHEAEVAQAFRQTEKLEELGLILSNFPVKEYRLAGQYYIGWSMSRKGQDAQELFEKVVEESDTYRARALIDLGSRQARKGDISSSITYYTEALKYSQTPYTIIQAERTLAAIKGDEGNHNKAIRHLEQIVPLVRYSPPIERYQYLNSLAVELIEVGRIEEASSISRIVLASPFTFAYPEWRETGAEAALRAYKYRSSVPVIRSFFKPAKIQNEKIQNVLSFPERNTAPVRLRSKPAKVLSYVDWKDKMVKEEKDEIPPDADEGDLYLRLIEMIALKDLSAWELRQVIDFVEKLRPNAEEN